MPLMVEKFTPDDWCHIDHLWKHGDLQDVNANVLFRDVYESLMARIVKAGFISTVEV